MFLSSAGNRYLMPAGAKEVNHEKKASMKLPLRAASVKLISLFLLPTNFSQ
jgi:hypothetical protein